MTPMPPGAGAARRPGVVQGVVLLLPGIMGVMGVLVLAPVVPRMVAHFRGVRDVTFWVTTLLTVPGLCLIVCSPLAGWAGDVFGRRKLLIGLTAVYAGFGVAPIFIDNLWLILASRVGVGVAEAGVLTLSTTLIGDTFSGPARDRWLGFQMGVASIGAIVCLLAGGALGSAFGWRGPFALYGIALLMGLAIALFTWEPDGDRVAASLAPIPPEPAPASFPWAAMLGICAITIFASILIFTWQIEAGLAFTALGVADPARIGMLTALASLGVCVGTGVFQFVTRVPVAWLLTVELAALGVTYVGLGLSRDAMTFLAVSAVNQLAAGMLMPTLLTWAVRQLPFAIRGRGLGMWQGSFALGTFFAGALIPVSIGLGGDVLASCLLPGAAGGIGGGVALAVALWRGGRLRRPGQGFQEVFVP